MPDERICLVTSDTVAISALGATAAPFDPGSDHVCFHAGPTAVALATGIRGDQGTEEDGASYTVNSASSERARRARTGNVGTVPPASNRATAAWVMRARRASSALLNPCWTRSSRTRRPSS